MEEGAWEKQGMRLLQVKQDPVQDLGPYRGNGEPFRCGETVTIVLQKELSDQEKGSEAIVNVE